MVWDLSIHRSNHSDIVDVFRGTRKQLADLNSRLTKFLKLEWRWKCSTSFAFCGQGLRQFLAGVLCQRWLRVKCIDM